MSGITIEQVKIVDIVYYEEEPSKGYIYTLQIEDLQVYMKSEVMNNKEYIVAVLNERTQIWQKMHGHVSISFHGDAICHISSPYNALSGVLVYIASLCHSEHVRIDKCEDVII